MFKIKNKLQMTPEIMQKFVRVWCVCERERERRSDVSDF